MNIKLFNSKQVDDIPWPETADGEHAKRFLTPILRDGIHHYIDNIHAEMQILICGDAVLPLTINEAQYNNAYVCSPHSYFISYAQESLDVVKSKVARKVVNWMLGGLGCFFRWAQINRVVVVNNWPYSTNLYPQITQNQIKEITLFLQSKFPDYAIVFRSIDPQTNPDCFTALKENQFAMIASRQIFFTDTRTTTFSDSRLFKSDLKLLHASGYEVVDDPHLSEEEQKRIVQLYKGLYITKYSQWNPQFNAKFVQLALDQKGLSFKILRKEGRIDGVVAYQDRRGILMCPFFGYDTSLPQETGLYRNLGTILFLQAQKEEKFFHQSAGASTYKTIRKAQSSIEYLAVLHSHLSLKRKAPWIFLQALFNTVGKKFMTKY